MRVSGMCTECGEHCNNLLAWDVGYELCPQCADIEMLEEGLEMDLVKYCGVGKIRLNSVANNMSEEQIEFEQHMLSLDPHKFECDDSLAPVRFDAELFDSEYSDTLLPEDEFA